MSALSKLISRTIIIVLPKIFLQLSLLFNLTEAVGGVDSPLDLSITGTATREQFVSAVAHIHNTEVRQTRIQEAQKKQGMEVEMTQNVDISSITLQFGHSAVRQSGINRMYHRGYGLNLLTEEDEKLAGIKDEASKKDHREHARGRVIFRSVTPILHFKTFDYHGINNGALGRFYFYIHNFEIYANSTMAMLRVNETNDHAPDYHDTGSAQRLKKMNYSDSDVESIDRDEWREDHGLIERNETHHVSKLHSHSIWRVSGPLTRKMWRDCNSVHAKYMSIVARTKKNTKLVFSKDYNTLCKPRLEFWEKAGNPIDNPLASLQSIQNLEDKAQNNINTNNNISKNETDGNGVVGNALKNDTDDGNALKNDTDDGNTENDKMSPPPVVDFNPVVSNPVIKASKLQYRFIPSGRDFWSDVYTCNTDVVKINVNEHNREMDHLSTAGGFTIDSRKYSYARSDADTDSNSADSGTGEYMESDLHKFESRHHGVELSFAQGILESMRAPSYDKLIEKNLDKILDPDAGDEKSIYRQYQPDEFENVLINARNIDSEESTQIIEQVEEELLQQEEVSRTLLAQLKSELTGSDFAHREIQKMYRADLTAYHKVDNMLKEVKDIRLNANLTLLNNSLSESERHVISRKAKYREKIIRESLPPLYEETGQDIISDKTGKPFSIVDTVDLPITAYGVDFRNLSLKMCMRLLSFSLAFIESPLAKFDLDKLLQEDFSLNKKKEEDGLELKKVDDQRREELAKTNNKDKNDLVSGQIEESLRAEKSKEEIAYEKNRRKSRSTTQRVEMKIPQPTREIVEELRTDGEISSADNPYNTHDVEIKESNSSLADLHFLTTEDEGAHSEFNLHVLLGQLATNVLVRVDEKYLADRRQKVGSDSSSEDIDSSSLTESEVLLGSTRGSTGFRRSSYERTNSNSARKQRVNMRKSPYTDSYILTNLTQLIEVSVELEGRDGYVEERADEFGSIEHRPQYVKFWQLGLSRATLIENVVSLYKDPPLEAIARLFPVTLMLISYTDRIFSTLQEHWRNINYETLREARLLEKNTTNNTNSIIKDVASTSSNNTVPSSNNTLASSSNGVNGVVPTSVVGTESVKSSSTFGSSIDDLDADDNKIFFSNIFYDLSDHGIRNVLDELERLDGSSEEVKKRGLEKYFNFENSLDRDLHFSAAVLFSAAEKTALEEKVVLNKKRTQQPVRAVTDARGNVILAAGNFTLPENVREKIKTYSYYKNRHHHAIGGWKSNCIHSIKRNNMIRELKREKSGGPVIYDLTTTVNAPYVSESIWEQGLEEGCPDNDGMLLLNPDEIEDGMDETGILTGITSTGTNNNHHEWVLSLTSRASVSQELSKLENAFEHLAHHNDGTTTSFWSEYGFFRKFLLRFNLCGNINKGDVWMLASQGYGRRDGHGTKKTENEKFEDPMLKYVVLILAILIFAFLLLSIFIEKLIGISVMDLIFGVEDEVSAYNAEQYAGQCSNDYWRSNNNHGSSTTFGSILKDKWDRVTCVATKSGKYNSKKFSNDDIMFPSMDYSKTVEDEFASAFTTGGLFSFSKGSKGESVKSGGNLSTIPSIGENISSSKSTYSSSNSKSSIGSSSFSEKFSMMGSSRDSSKNSCVDSPRSTGEDNV